MTAQKNLLPDQPVQRSMVARVGIVAAKLMVSAAILVLVARVVDFPRLAQRLADVQLPLVGVAALLLFAQLALASLRWRLVIYRLQSSADLPLRAVLAITMAAQFANQFLPFAAGDALRALLMTRVAVSTRVSITSVLTDRGIGLLVLLLIAAPPLLLSSLAEQMPAVARTLLLVVAILLSLFAVVLVASSFLIRLFSSAALAAPLAVALEDMRSVVLHPPTFAATALLSLVIHGVSIGAVWLLSVAIAMPLPLMSVWALVPPMMLASTLPFTVGGWGAREGAVVGFLAGAGIPADGALLLSLVFGATMLVVALPGAATWFAFVQQKR